MERAGEREIVDVVARFLSDRPRLTPAGHPRVDKAGIGLATNLRPEAKALHYAGTKPFDQDVGLRNQLQHCRHGGWFFQIQSDGALIAIVEVEAPLRVGFGSGSSNTVDADDIR